LSSAGPSCEPSTPQSRLRQAITLGALLSRLAGYGLMAVGAILLVSAFVMAAHERDDSVRPFRDHERLDVTAGPNEVRYIYLGPRDNPALDIAPTTSDVQCAGRAGTVTSGPGNPNGWALLDGWDPVASVASVTSAPDGTLSIECRSRDPLPVQLLLSSRPPHPDTFIGPVILFLLGTLTAILGILLTATGFVVRYLTR
jgi:hypothetical protein